MVLAGILCWIVVLWFLRNVSTFNVQNYLKIFLTQKFTFQKITLRVHKKPKERSFNTPTRETEKQTKEEDNNQELIL